MAIEIVEIPEENRYEARDGAEVLGFSEYKDTPDARAFIHTEVEPKHRGEGIAGALAKRTLLDVRELGMKALPVCPFYVTYIKRHPEFADLVTTD